MSLTQRLSQPLSRTWAWIAFAIWAAVGLALGFVGSSSRRTGKPTWWIDGIGALPAAATILLVFALPVGVLLVRFWWPRWLVIAQICGVFALLITTIADVSRAPGASIIEFAITLAAFLGTISTLAGLPLKHVKSAHIAA